MKNKRTIKRVVDLSRMVTISSDDLMSASPDRYQSIRRSATEAKQSGNPIFVCEKCGFPVYAPRRVDRLPHWQHYKGAPTNCPWWTGDPNSIDEVSARQFHGNQESKLHFKLKYLISDLFKLDPCTDVASVKVENYLVTEDGRRCPDVQLTYGGRPLAVEVQLATTQLPIILGRESFYQRSGRSLIWLTWQFDITERHALPTAFEDIYYSHRKNLFSLDDDVIALSQKSRRFLLRVSWEIEGNWNTKICSLADLTWPEDGLPYGIVQKPWYVIWREKWLNSMGDYGVPKERRIHLYLELKSNILHSVSVDFLEENELDDIINCILSFTERKGIGSRQLNLKEVINTFLFKKRFWRYARMMRDVLRNTGYASFFDNEKLRKKFQAAFDDELDQETRNDPIGQIVIELFPDVFSGRYGEMAGYVTCR